MVRKSEPEGDDAHEALVGVVTVNGEMVLRDPFVEPLPTPVFRPSVAPLDPLPRQAVPLLRKALEARRTGLLILGTNEIQEHWAVDLVNAVLPLTDFAGPAARIKPRSRSTAAKDWNVPDALKALPFLPSIESAYSQGYRRMVVNPSYSDADLLLEYGSEVLFIAGGHGSSVDDLFLGGVRFSRYEKVAESVGLLVAILAVTRLKAGRVDVGLPDLYIPDGREPDGEDKLESLLAMLHRDRVLRAEDQLAELLDHKRVTVAVVKKGITRTKWVTEFLAQRAKGAGRKST